MPSFRTLLFYALHFHNKRFTGGHAAIVCDECGQLGLFFTMGKTDQVGVTNQVVFADHQLMLRLHQIGFEATLAI